MLGRQLMLKNQTPRCVIEKTRYILTCTPLPLLPPPTSYTFTFHSLQPGKLSLPPVATFSVCSPAHYLKLLTLDSKMLVNGDHKGQIMIIKPFELFLLTLKHHFYTHLNLHTGRLALVSLCISFHLLCTISHLLYTGMSRMCSYHTMVNLNHLPSNPPPKY